MTPQLNEAWAALEARAQRLLEHAREVPPRDEVRHFGSLLRLWHLPANQSPCHWTILVPGRRTADAEPRVREVVWDRDADERRLFDARDISATPAIRLREAIVPSVELNRLVAAGRDLSVPMLASAEMAGLDGEYFGIETYEVSPNVRAQWWCEGPTEWRHFTDWVASLRAFLLECLRSA
jgi:hypothetical protein